MQKGKKPKRKPQQRDDIAKGIDTIQEVAETAISIYRVIEPIAKAILAIWGERQMSRPKWYTPQLSREIVRRLYYRAKAEGVAMTTLVNRIVQTALDKEEVVQRQLSPDASAIATTGDRDQTELNQR